EGVFVVKAIAHKSAEFGIATERRLLIEGNNLIIGVKTENGAASKFKNPFVVPKRNVMSGSSRHAMKRELINALGVITRISGSRICSLGRVVSNIGEVECCRASRDQIITLMINARRLCGAKYTLGGRQRTVSAWTDVHQKLTNSAGLRKRATLVEVRTHVEE